MSQAFFVAVILITILSLSSQSKAAEYTRFSASVGVFITDRETDTRIDASSSDPGTDVDLEGDLGFDASDSVFRFDGYWRFAENHRFDVSVFDLSRSSSKVIDTDITIGDTTYPVDFEVNGELDFTVYKAAYTWMFHNRDDYFVGASAGVYVADIGAQFAGPLGADRESHEVTAPLPVFGLRGDYQLSERWKLRGSAEVFALEFDSFDGSFYDVFAGVDYSLTDFASLGFGVNTVRLNLGIDDDNLNGDLDWSYSGAMLYLKFDF